MEHIGLILKRRGRQLKLLALLMPTIFWNIAYARTVVAESPPLIITELQTGTTDSATQEFIEIYNCSGNDVNLSNWFIQYFSSSAINLDKPSRTIPLSGKLPAGTHHLVASSNYLQDKANDSFAATLAGAGGHVRLAFVNNGTTEGLELLTWGTTKAMNSSALTAPPAGQSIARRQNSASGQTVEYAVTGKNDADFELSTPSPEGHIKTPELSDTSDEAEGPATMPATDPIAGSGESPVSDQPTSTSPPEYISFPQIQITELLPNPAAPQTDSNDEFLELYNPTDQIVDLSGWKLRSGSTLSHNFTIGQQAIGPHSYLALYSSQTKLSLANSGGRAQLLNPNGEVSADTMSYGTAQPGQSWAWDGATWVWTTEPTPNAANTIVDPAKPKQLPSSGLSKTTAAKAVAGTKITKAASAGVSKAAKATTTKTGTAKKPSGSNKPNGTADSGHGSLHPAILAAVGGGAVIYGAYEYRQDLANLYRKLRRHRGVSAPGGAAA